MHISNKINNVRDMNTQTKSIGIHIGAMCDPIRKQLKAQGVIVSTSEVSHFQRAHDGIVQLSILGCIGDKEKARISQRFVSKVAKFASKKIS